MLRVACPRCGIESDIDESEPLPKQFPFCSERCRLVDLGKWFDEDYRIPGRAPHVPDEPPPNEG